MSKNKVKRNRTSAIKDLNTFLDELEATDLRMLDKLSYWIRNYVIYLRREKCFKPDTLLKYKRGDILKVNFGFRIGSELGGLHYCIVLDNNNSPKSPTVTVLPLSSLKDGVHIHKLPKDRIYLGEELNEKIASKANERIDYWQKKLTDAVHLFSDENISKEELDEVQRMTQEIHKDALRIHNEFKNMKQGSVALVGQITTISKIRIYEPKTQKDLLCNIRVSPENLDLINKKIGELYMCANQPKT